MRILAIETSCDDTSIAILKGGNSFFDFEILSNIVSSQVKIHKKFGGVFPFLARREHQKNLVFVLKRALFEASLLERKEQKKEIKEEKIIKKILKREEKLCQNFLKFIKRYKKPKIDLIAITVGPGLEPCLWSGVNFAKALAFWLNKKIIPINHIEAHIFSSFLSEKNKEILKRENGKIFPAISLIVSGGHTQIFLVKNFGKYKILGQTRDDAAGEAFDKIARILGLPYPGGPWIEKISKIKVRNILKYRNIEIKLPRPMIFSKDYDFSFSGLKTAVLYDYKKRKKEIRESKEYIAKMAKEAQEAIVEVLVKKTIEAAKDFNAKSIILGGGVSANQRLREKFKEEVDKLPKKIILFFPEKIHATDNAAMSALCAYFYWLKSDKIKNWEKIKADSNLKIK